MSNQKNQRISIKEKVIIINKIKRGIKRSVVLSVHKLKITESL